MQARSREWLYFWDSKDCNPNGDMLNDNKPRQDEVNGQLETSDARLKRFQKDYLNAKGDTVAVYTRDKAEGKVMNNKDNTDYLRKILNVGKDEDIVKAVNEACLDARLFGFVFANEKKNQTGTLQISWSRTVHKGVVEYVKGNSPYANGEAEQVTFSEKYMTPYALFKTYMRYSNLTAKNQNVVVSEADLDKFRVSLIRAMKQCMTTSKNPLPRLMIEVITKDDYIDGDLNYVDIVKHKGDTELRDISDVTFDLARLTERIEKLKNAGFIDTVNVYVDGNTKVINAGECFNIIDMI